MSTLRRASGPDNRKSEAVGDLRGTKRGLLDHPMCVMLGTRGKSFTGVLSYWREFMTGTEKTKPMEKEVITDSRRTKEIIQIKETIIIFY